MKRGTVPFLIFAASLLRVAAPLAPLPQVRELRVGPISASKTGVEVIFGGPAAPCGERLKGSFSVLGSGGIPVDGTLAPHPEEGCSVRFDMPFSSVGPDALARMNFSAVDWSLAGELSENGKRRTVKWAGSIPREAVELTESMKVTLQRFVAVKEVRLGSLGVATSTVNVDIELKNPLAFDLQFVEVAYELTLEGEPLARGRKEKFLLHAGRPNLLVLPVELSHPGILTSLWKAASDERVVGVLTGVAKLCVPPGDMDLPFELPVTVSRM